MLLFLKDRRKWKEKIVLWDPKTSKLSIDAHWVDHKETPPMAALFLALRKED